MRLRDEEMLTRGLRSLGGEMESLSAPPALEGTLLEAFRARQVVVPISRRSSSARYWLAAVAAVLLIVMSVVALRFRASESQAPRRDVAGVESPIKQEERKAPIEPTKEREKELQTAKLDDRPIIRRPSHRAPSQRSPRPQVANHVTQEIATDFIPLSYMNAANFQDGGQIVRVQLPRSALASFGLPVNMDRYNEKVKADVLFGVDGLAHAIRFVQ